MAAQQPTLLYVDDDEVILRAYSWVFERAGFTVRTATTGRDALRLAAAAKPDLIVLDIRLPDLDGYEVCRRLKAEPATAAIPVLHLSAAYVTSEARAHGLEGGADGYLVKPVDARELLATVRSLLRVKEAEGAVREAVRQWQTTFDATADAVCLLDREGRVLRCNQAMAALLGPSGGAALGRRCRDLLPGEPGAAAEALRAHVQETHRRGAQDVPSAGRWFRLTVDPVPDEGGAVAGTVHTWRDITDRRQAEEALQFRVRQQAAVAELGRRALANANLAELRHEAVALVAQTLAVEFTRVLEWLPDSPALLVRAGVGWTAGTVGRATVPAGSGSMAGYTLLSREPVVVEDLRAETRFAVPELLSAHGVVSSLSVPLPGSSGASGVLSAETRCRRAFTRDDVHFLEAVAHVLGMAAERRAAEEARLATEAELRAARRIQQRLFPAAVPRLAGLDIAGARHGLDVGGASYPAEATGGDYYDYIPMPDGSLGVVVGDVSGHGFGPALLMAEARAYLRGLAWTHTDVGQILTLANRILAEDIEESRFITLLFVCLEPRTRSLVYASAGHLSGYILDPEGRVRESLQSTGPPLGIIPEAEIPRSGRIPLEDGALVLLFTDGLVEAHSPDGSTFGTQRVLSTARHYRRDSAQQIVNNLYHASRAFCQNAPQTDDITVTVIRVQPGP